MQLKGCFGGLLVLVGLLQKSDFCSTLKPGIKGFEEQFFVVVESGGSARYVSS